MADVSENKRNILPVEQVCQVSWRMMAVTILAVLLSSVVLNETVKVLLRRHPALNNTTYVVFMEQWERLTDLEEPVDTLILGDSSGYHGVDPEILADALGGYSLNLCTFGDAALINPVWQLETYLERHGAPHRVILVAVHDLWIRDLSTPLIPKVPLPWGFWQRSRASWPFERAELWDVFVAHHIPVYSQDKTITRRLMYPWRIRNRPQRSSPRGFYPLQKAEPEKTVQDGANHLRKTAPRGWNISEQSHVALEAIIALADENGFDFYIANSPQLAGMVNDPAFGQYYTKGQQVLADLVAVSPRAHLILSPPAEYPPQLMQNSDHIVQEAVDDFTRRVAAGVAACEGQ